MVTIKHPSSTFTKIQKKSLETLWGRDFGYISASFIRFIQQNNHSAFADLIAMGAQDAFLTQNPSIRFFTKFAHTRC